MEKLGIEPILLLTQVINFTILVVVLTKFLYKPILKMLDERKKKIEEGLTLSREMATAGSMDGVRAIFQGKFKTDTLNRLIQLYAEAFVICPVCRRPDTKIVKEKRFSFLSCEACGAKSSARAI